MQLGSSAFVLISISVVAATLISHAAPELRPQGAPPRQEDRVVPAKSRYAAVNGIRIHYLEWGREGAPVVLLHGLYDNADVWKTLAPRLMPDCHVVAPDRRGMGLSDTPKLGYDPATLVSDVIGLVREKKLGSVVLVGHSAGAEIALRIAAEEPPMVRSLIMVDGGFWPKRNADLATTPSAPCSNLDECARWLTLENASRQYDPEALYPRVSCPVLLIVAHQPNPAPDILAALRERGINYDEKVRKAEEHVREVAGQKLRRGRLTVIENTGHWIQKDQPLALGQAIRSFLSGIQ